MAKAKRKKTIRTSAKRRSKARRRSAIEVALASLAHEIRTPLTGILALAELLNTSDLPERERRWAETIRGAADHLARLTAFVVDAARADAAGLALRTESFSPRDLARSVAGLLAVRAEGKGLEAVTEINDDLPPRLKGDVVRLRSALENLIDNAVKFTEHGRVGFAASAARAAKGRVRLAFTVTDSGIGIKPAELKQLFQPFAQANPDIARRFGGTGLGLVFVKRIAEVMGGGLKVTSKSGHGSAFRMTVVLENGAPAAPGAADSVVMPSLRVLCVEDNPYGRVVLGTILRELGHTVSFTGRGDLATDIVARGDHNVVLMDIALSGIDGIETTRRIRALPAPASAIPIIGVSGKTEADDEAAARAAGMSDYLRKPVTPAELYSALQAVSRVSGA